MNYQVQINEFKNALLDGITNIHRAAEIYVDTIDHYSDAKKAFKEAVPSVPYTMWTMLEKIGRGQLHEKLLFGGGRARHVLQTLTLSEQRECLECGVSVLLHDGNVAKISPEKMMPSQVEQCFATGLVRDIEGQRAWIESKRKNTIPSIAVHQREQTFYIKGNEMFVCKATSFTREEIENIINTWRD